MPKGKAGCWACGAATEVIVQSWLKDYTNEFHASARGPVGATRKMTTINSVSRSLCRVDGDVLYANCEAELRGHLYQGCSICGESPTFSRIHVWERTVVPSKSIRSLSRGYCEKHSREVYRAVAKLLDAATATPTGQQGGTMKGARAARVARAAGP